MRLAAFIIAAGLGLACGAPEDRDDAGADQAARPIAGGPTRLPPDPGPEEPRVELLERGERPHRRLRYRPEVGEVYEIDFSMKGELALSSYGARMFGQSVDMTSSYRLVVAGVDTRGDITLDVTITRYDLPDFAGRPGFTGGGRLEGRIIVSDRGIIREVDLPFLEDHPQLDGSFNASDFFLVLPAEPVGAGGRWKTETAVMRNGISETVVEIQRLVELEGERARTAAELSFATLPQQVPALSRAPAGLMELERYESEASSETTLDLGAALPVRSTTRFEFAATMNTRTPEGVRPVEMTMKATMLAGRTGGR